MADIISLIQDVGLDDCDEGVFEQGDCSGPSDDDALPPVLRVQKYAESGNIYDRQMVPRIVLEIIQTAPAGSLNQDIPRIMAIVTDLGEKDEGLVKVDLLEQIPHMAFQALEHSNRLESLKGVIGDYLLPLVVRNLGSSDSTVDKAAHSALLQMLEQGLITLLQAEIQVCPAVLALSNEEQTAEINTNAIHLMSKMAPILGRDITERVFVKKFSDLCASLMFYVRKVCASRIGDFCVVVGRDQFEKVLLPCYIKLCEDEIWGVRKACAEVIMFVSTVCPAQLRKFILSPAFVKLLQDDCRWVQMSAFQTLGPFITTFADPPVTRTAYNNQGDLVFIDQNGNEFMLNMPTMTDVKFCKYMPLKQPVVVGGPPQSLNETARSDEFYSWFKSDDYNFQDTTTTEEEEEGGEEKDPAMHKKIFNKIGSEQDIAEIVETVKNAVLNYRAVTPETGYIGDILAAKNLQSSIINNSNQRDATCKNCDNDNKTLAVVEQDSTSNSSSKSKNDESSSKTNISRDTVIAAAPSSSRGNSNANNDDKNSRSKSAQETAAAEDTLLSQNKAATTSSDQVISTSSSCTTADATSATADESENNNNNNNNNEESNLHLYNSYNYWYIRPECVVPLDDVPAGDASLLSNSGGCDDVDDFNKKSADETADDVVTANIEELYSSISLNDELKESSPPREDEDHDVLNISNDELKPEISANSQDIVPPDLIEFFMLMTNSAFSITIDNEMAYHCAYSLPAVALTLKDKNWPLLKSTIERLAGHLQYKVRRCMASSLHELAGIFGPEITTEHLAPLFGAFIKDLDEVRIGIIKHLADFLRHVDQSKRDEYLPRLHEFLKIDYNSNWRYRYELAQQVLQLVRLFRPVDSIKHLGPIAERFLHDVSAVRHEGISIITELVGHISAKPGINTYFMSSMVEKFAHSKRWKRRQTFALLCFRLLENEAIPPEQFATEMMPHLLDLSWDPVANVRLVVAKTLAQHIIPNEYFADPNNQHLDSLGTVLRRLQSDKDRDVRELAEVIKIDRQPDSSTSDSSQDCTR